MTDQIQKKRITNEELQKVNTLNTEVQGLMGSGNNPEAEKKCREVYEIWKSGGDSIGMLHSLNILCHASGNQAIHGGDEKSLDRMSSYAGEMAIICRSLTDAKEQASWLERVKKIEDMNGTFRKMFENPLLVEQMRNSKKA
jgi:hypothetical protein